MRTLLARTLGKAAVLGLAAGTVTGIAFAGVVMKYEVKGPGKGGAGVVSLGADRIRMETGETTMIFRGDKQLIWILQPKEGKYVEMTKEQMKAMGDQISGAMAQMKEQIQNLPPEQRAMVEQMMKKRMPQADAAKPEPVTYVRTGKPDTVAGMSCVTYDAMRGTKKASEMCVTDWKSLGIKAADMKALEQLGEFMKDAIGPMMKQFSIGFDQKFADTGSSNALPGVPLRIVTPSEDGDTVMEIQKIAHEDVPAAQFEVPAGLTKESMGDRKMKMEMKTAPKDKDADLENEDD